MMRISAKKHAFENLRYHKISQIPSNFEYVNGIVRLQPPESAVSFGAF
jgi:hypothetical protein